MGYREDEEKRNYAICNGTELVELLRFGDSCLIKSDSRNGNE